MKCSSTLRSLTLKANYVFGNGLKGITKALTNFELISLHSAESLVESFYLNKDGMAIIESFPNLEQITGF